MNGVFTAGARRPSSRFILCPGPLRCWKTALPFAVVLGLALGIFGSSALANGPVAGGHHPPGHEEEGTAPEAFVVLDLFTEVLEASAAGIGVKLVELKPKIEHISDLYQRGEEHKALAMALGISTEMVLLGFFIEIFGIGEMFVSALSLADTWMIDLAKAAAGVALSTKVALLAGEKVEEATEEKYQHAIRAEANAARSHSRH
jgi:hypothetical protein